MKNEKFITKAKLIQVQIPDEDADMLSKKAANINLSVGELVERFIKDLIGDASEDGLEQVYDANLWYETYYMRNNQTTLLSYLLTESINPAEYLSVIRKIEEIEEELKRENLEPEIKKELQLTLLKFRDNVGKMEKNWRGSEKRQAEEYKLIEVWLNMHRNRNS
jgi:hypothetical protein